MEQLDGQLSLLFNEAEAYAAPPGPQKTTLQVLHEPGKKAQTKSYMWLYRTGRDGGSSIVLYEYQPNRKAEHAVKFLEGFSEYVHADGYQGYHSLPGNIRVVGCWAHARRKFYEALNALPTDKREGRRLELSSNRAERGVKSFVIGKNFLFANTPLGAQASSVIYSLIETAKEPRLDPFRYLTWVWRPLQRWSVPWRAGLRGCSRLMRQSCATT